MKKRFSEFIFKALRKVGIFNPTVSLQSALDRCVFRKTEIKTVIDIGASNGCWSKIVKKYFSQSFYYLIEANPYHAPALQKLRTQWNNYDYTLAAAGDTIGEIYFNGSDPLGGIASHVKTEKTTLVVPTVTIDYIIEKYNLKPPYLLKLDTHGFELPIFEGATKTLLDTSLIIVEVYNFDITPDSLRFYKICEYLEKKSFRCIDMCDPLFRSKDKALWQFDLFFIPASSPYFYNNQWL